MAVELDTDNNGAIDVDKGGTNSTTAAGARANLGLSASVADYTAARALTGLSAGQIVSIAYRTTIGDDGGGDFVYRAGNFTSQVTADTLSGVYLPLDSDPTGATGVLVRNKMTPLIPAWFGVQGTGLVDDGAAYQGLFDFADANSSAVNIPDGDYLIDTVVDLSSPGGGDESYRNMFVVCSERAIFRASTNTTDLFNISGQRRMTWRGGLFTKARRCFTATNGIPAAYCRFENIRFAGSGASAIGAGFYGDSYIGNVWSKCQFGTDGATDQIDVGVDFTATSSNQTNVNHFDRCIFINFKDHGVHLRASAFLKANTTFSKCWFEDSDGIAVETGSNTKGVTFDDCYIETVGGVSAPLKFADSVGVQVLRPIMLAPNAIPAWISADNTEISVRDAASITLDGFPFVALTNLPSARVQLTNNLLTPTGTPTYKAALFSIDDANDERLVLWDIPRDSSTTTADGKTLLSTAVAREYSDGFLRHQTDSVTLSADTTWFTVATLTIPGATSGCRVTVDLQQIHQGVGLAAAFLEAIVTRSGGGAPSTTVLRSNTVGGTLTLQIVASGNDAVVQVMRTGGSNTPVAPIITVYQGDADINTKRVSIA